jgi:hypothetical protein
MDSISADADAWDVALDDVKVEKAKSQNTEMTIRYGIILLLCFLLTLTLLLIPVREARGDGGVIQMTKTTDIFVITVYTASSPLRAGPADISVLIQTRENSEPVLNAQVLIRLHKENGVMITAQATPASAQNKLLYAATMNIPEAGQWEMEVIIRQGDKTVSIAETIVVAPSRSVLHSHWQNLALPPLVVFLFVLTQWLKRRHQFLSEARKQKLE